MTSKAQDIAAMLNPTVEALGLQLLGVEYLPAPGGALLRLYIDTPYEGGQASERSVVIEDCEAVSREVSAQLDVADPIAGHYTLEVSSPGLERPLFTAAQFARFVGETAKVTLKLPQDGRRRLQASIARVEGDDIVLTSEEGEWTVGIDNIEKARLVPDWAALGLAPAEKPSAGKGRGKTKQAPADKRATAKKSSTQPSSQPAAKASRGAE